MDEALNKSGELLKRIASDERLPRDAPSDIESANTDTLINMNPGAAAQRKGVDDQFAQGESSSSSTSHSRKGIVFPVGCCLGGILGR